GGSIGCDVGGAAAGGGGCDSGGGPAGWASSGGGGGGPACASTAGAASTTESKKTNVFTMTVNPFAQWVARLQRLSSPTRGDETNAQDFPGPRRAPVQGDFAPDRASRSSSSSTGVSESPSTISFRWIIPSTSALWNQRVDMTSCGSCVSRMRTGSSARNSSKR